MVPQGYLQARVNVCYAGVTHLGWVHPSCVMTIGGDDKSAHVLYEDFSITDDREGARSTCQFVLKDGLVPAIGQDVTITFAQPNEFLFGGTILRYDAAPQGPYAEAVRWRCTAYGYRWLLDAYDLVLRNYEDVGAGTMVRDILARYTNPAEGWRVGYIPKATANLWLGFQYASVSAAFDRIAAAMGWWWEVTPEKIVNMCELYPEAAQPTLSAADEQALVYAEDGTQLRTRAVFAGEGTTVTALAAPTATSIAVAETSLFSAAGGYALSGHNQITYTGLSAASGPGTLTGVSGLSETIELGAAIQVLVIYDDAAAQTNLGATPLGLTRIPHFFSNDQLSLTELTDRAAADVGVFGGALKSIRYRQTEQRTRYLRPGRTVSFVGMTEPVAISTSFQVQQMRTYPRGKIVGTDICLYRDVYATRFNRSLSQLIGDVTR